MSLCECFVVKLLYFQERNSFCTLGNIFLGLDFNKRKREKNKLGKV